jgi:hypothetical protein
MYILSKKSVFRAKSSGIALTKTALTAKFANFCLEIWSGFLFLVIKGSIKNAYNYHFEFPFFARKIM